jgi:hypothetical protein
MRAWCAFVLATLAFAWTAPAHAVTEDPGRKRFREAVAQVWQLLDAREFARLEALHDEWLKTPSRTQDGTWLLESFDWTFAVNFEARAPAYLRAIFDDWKARAPSSRLRPIAEAHLWVARAGRLRGCECSKFKSDADRDAFGILIERAAAALNAEAMGVSPLAYTAALRIAGSRGRPAGELDALLDEGRARFPAYRPMYWARMRYLLPAWGGTGEALDHFAKRAVRETSAAEGTTFYALLYADLLREGPPQSRELMLEHASWPELDASFRDLVARRPGTHNWNLYGTVACLFRDAPATARILQHLGSEAQLGVWTSGVSTESCRAILLSPVEKRRLTMR